MNVAQFDGWMASIINDLAKDLILYHIRRRSNIWCNTFGPNPFGVSPSSQIFSSDLIINPSWYTSS